MQLLCVWHEATRYQLCDCEVAKAWAKVELGGELEDIFLIWIIAYFDQTHKKAWKVGYAINLICVY